MKRLTTTIIGLSLLAGSALSAEEKFASFYPIENSDTPDYLVSFSDNKGEVFQTLAKSGIQHCTLTAFYPEEGLDTRVQTSC